uniref:Uncharacterized protein n=1 Tax=viral metagenome TaxID=1070528 RepID=A0A6C0D6Z1_9ZZZZ
MPNWNNRWEESGNFRMFDTSPKKASPKNALSVIKSELESKTKKEIQEYYEGIGGDENLIHFTKEKMIKEVVNFSKEILGMEGGKRSATRCYTRKNRTRRS